MLKIAVNKVGRYSPLVLKMKISSAITEGKRNHRELCFVIQDNRLSPLPFFFFSFGGGGQGLFCLVLVFWFSYGIFQICTISLWVFMYRYKFRVCSYFNHLSKLKFINKHFPKSLLCTRYCADIYYLLTFSTILVLIFSAGTAVGSCKRKERNG